MQYDNDVNKRLMDRPGYFDPGHRTFGEITGHQFQFNELDQGMPMRSDYLLNERHPEEPQINTFGSSYNPSTDFDLYNKPPSNLADVSYHEPSGVGFSSLGERHEILGHQQVGAPSIINGFSLNFLNLFRSAIRQSKPLILSPFSIIQTFNILYRGSKGSTQEELKNVFNFSDKASNFESFVKLNNVITNTGAVKIANCILVDRRFPLIEPFRQYVSKVALIEPLDTANPNQAVRKINNFISQNTNNMINNTVNPGMISDSSRMVIVNTIYFYSRWKNPFSPQKTKQEVFNGTPRRMVNMMSKKEFNTSYFEDPINQVMEMDFAIDGLSMGFVLPKNNVQPSMNDEQYYVYTQGLSSVELAIVKLPKFTSESKFEISKMFKHMGLRHVFSYANLSDMTSSREPTYIDKIIHQAKIIVDENGAEASAATVMLNSFGCTGTSPKPMFIANKPFLYYIRHKPSNTLLFTGVYC